MNRPPRVSSRYSAGRVPDRRKYRRGAGVAEIRLALVFDRPLHTPFILLHDATAKREGADGWQIVEEQTRRAIAQAPPQAKNTERPGERGLAEGEAKKEGIAHRGSVFTRVRTQSEVYFHTINIASRC